MSDPVVIARFTLEGEPVSKQRAGRAKSGRSYTPEQTRTAEDRVAWTFRQVTGPQPLDPTHGFGVYAGFFCSTGQRRDVDNMTKLILDGLNGVAWADDSQVTEISAKVARWVPDPRTEVVIYRTPLVLHPAQRCEQCGQYFPLYRSSKPRRWCSQECRRVATWAELTCAHCGGVFWIKPSQRGAQRHCSRECQRKAQAAALIHITCAHCGRDFTKRPSERKDTPNRQFCSLDCRNRALRRGAYREPGTS